MIKLAILAGGGSSAHGATPLFRRNRPTDESTYIICPGHRSKCLDKAWALMDKFPRFPKDSCFPQTPEDGPTVAYAGHSPVRQAGPGCQVTMNNLYRETCMQEVYYA
jgi:hypothetical protein